MQRIARKIITRARAAQMPKLMVTAGSNNVSKLDPNPPPPDYSTDLRVKEKPGNR